MCPGVVILGYQAHTFLPQESVVEECALEGPRGVLLHDLFSTVARSRGLCISAPLQALLWQRMRALPVLEFSFDAGRGARVSDRNLPSLALSRALAPSLSRSLVLSR